MTQALELHRPNFDERFYLQANVSAFGLGAVLCQKDDAGTKNIISYTSATLTKTEAKYHINELEVYAAIYGILKY